MWSRQTCVLFDVPLNARDAAELRRRGRFGMLFARIASFFGWPKRLRDPEYLSALAAERPGDADVRAALALAYWKNGRLTEALDALRAAIDLLSGSAATGDEGRDRLDKLASLHLVLGAWLRAAGRNYEANAALQTAIQLSPDSRTAAGARRLL